MYVYTYLHVHVSIQYYTSQWKQSELTALVISGIKMECL